MPCHQAPTSSVAQSVAISEAGAVANFFEPEGMSVKYIGKPQICLNCQVKSVNYNYDTQMNLQAVDEAGGIRSNQELSKFESWQIVSRL